MRLPSIEIARLEATPIEGVAERLGLRVERHKCLCPWHEDSRPSLTFNTYKNRYRCFVCDAHGGVIDLVMKLRGCRFREACEWLEGGGMLGGIVPSVRPAGKEKQVQAIIDIGWLTGLMRPKVLNDDARRFLFEERKLDERVIAWCGLSSISYPTPCWRYGRPFYDAPSLLIPYYDMDGRLMSVQSRYLGTEDRPRFKFPRGSNCHVYGMQILRYLREGEELWITEGCSDCWAMLSAGKKAIAIPSATLLKDKDIEPLRGLNLHMCPDQDLPGEKLFLALRERLPQLVRHQLPSGFKDFGAWYASAFSNRVAKADAPVVSGRPMLPLSPPQQVASGAPKSRLSGMGWPPVETAFFAVSHEDPEPRDGKECRLYGRPTANSQQPTANGQQPTANGQRPTANSQC